MKGSRPGLLLAAALLLYLWSGTRIDRMVAYQTPPHPIMHANYYTFHDMSEQWNQTGVPGRLNATKNSQYYVQNNPYLDYGRFRITGEPFFCDYLDLDVGFQFPVGAARYLFAGVLPDNYLRTLALQVVVDLLALAAVFAIGARFGWIAAVGGAVMYAINEPIAMQAALTFYYFWDGMVALAVLLLGSALFSRSRRGRWSWDALALAIVLGAVLGFGVWLRSSWGVYSPLLIALLWLPQTLRRYMPVTALVLVVVAAYPVVRASRALDHFSVTTRQSWAAAFEALGKDPNPYGLENDDQYLYDLARDKYGAVDAACQGFKRDAALRTEYRRVWERDPAFVIHSVANRMYLGFLSNGAEQHDTVDRNMLILALLGAGWMAFRGGRRRWLALPAASLFVISTAATCFVYFMTAHYNGVPQVCLILLGIGAFDLVAQLVPRRRDFDDRGRRFRAIGRLARLRRWPLLAAMTVVVLTAVTLQQPGVRAYFAAPLYIHEWYLPADPTPEQLTARIAAVRQLPVGQQNRLLASLGVSVGATDETIAAALGNKFKHLVGQNVRDNVSKLEMDVDATAAPAIQQALWHAERFILGFNPDAVRGYDPAVPETWSGTVFSFRINSLDGPALERIVPVFTEKFEHRGFALRSRTGNTFVFAQRPAQP